jgi:hypothetical protein
MDIKDARDLLIKYNQWRRDDNVPNSHEMPNPKDIGLAIDAAIYVLNLLLSPPPEPIEQRK